MEGKYGLRDFSREYSREIDNSFASACYDDNTIEELEKAGGYKDSRADRENWGITYQEWKDGI